MHKLARGKSLMGSESRAWGRTMQATSRESWLRLRVGHLPIAYRSWGGLEALQRAEGSSWGTQDGDVIVEGELGLVQCVGGSRKRPCSRNHGTGHACAVAGDWM